MLESATVVRLATSIDPRFRCLVLVAGFVGLRTGELLGLTRKDVDLLHRVLHVKRQSQEISGRRTITEPKTQAGIRSLSLPAALVAELTHHLDTYAAPGSDGAVFTGRSGLPVRRADLGEAWHAALEAEGLSGLRVHDLRHHAATTFARKPDVTLKELMAAIGHASPVAALRYQHATEERGRELADYMDNIITNARADEPPTAGVVRMGSPKAKRDARGMQAPAKT